MTWWLWIVLGLILLGLELSTPGGFFIAFFGAGALVVGLLTGSGLAGPVWLQWLLFSILSIVFLIFFRRPLLEWMKRRGGQGRAARHLLERAQPGGPGPAARPALPGGAGGGVDALGADGVTGALRGDRCRHY